MSLSVTLDRIFNLQGLFIAVPLVALVLLLAWFFARSKKKKVQKPGQLLYYTVPGKTAAACRSLLGSNTQDDLFSYKLESSAGGWHIHFVLHNPTGQPLDTLFQLQFVDEAPTMLEVRFAREAFGMREPVIGEELLDIFFEQKLGAVRAPAPQNEEDAPA